MFKTLCCLIFLGVSGALFASATQINDYVIQGKIRDAVALIFFSDEPIMGNDITHPVLRELHQRSRSWGPSSRADFLDDLGPMPELAELQFALNQTPQTLGEQGRQPAFRGAFPG
jgi:hypothetical protein